MLLFFKEFDLKTQIRRALRVLVLRFKPVIASKKADKLLVCRLKKNALRICGFSAVQLTAKGSFPDRLRCSEQRFQRFDVCIHANTPCSSKRWHRPFSAKVLAHD